VLVVEPLVEILSSFINCSSVAEKALGLCVWRSGPVSVHCPACRMMPESVATADQ